MPSSKVENHSSINFTGGFLFQKIQLLISFYYRVAVCSFSFTMTFVRGKVALVTGGASGIGLAVAIKLLESGAKGVAIVDLSETNGKEAVSNLQKQYGESVIFINADVTKDVEYRNAFEKTIEKFKNLDIVFNNAGIWTATDWEKVVSVNLIAVMRGTFLAIQEYLPKYKSSEESLILNTASVLGLDTVEDGTVYCTTKHGIVGLGKSLKQDDSCLKNGIRVLTVCPGVTLSPLVSSIIEANQGVIPEQMVKVNKMISSLDYIGNAVLEIIDKGEHGSVWVAEDETTPYEVVFPNRSEMRKTS